MPQFRKKPVVIEAYPFTMPLPDEPMPKWLLEAFNVGTAWFQGGDEPYVTIRTLEGDRRASVGDWIIRGGDGLYPCKPEIFKATYEPV